MLSNHFNGTMVSVKDSSVVACGLDSRHGQFNDLKFVRLFSTKYTALRAKNNEWFARSQEYVSE